MRFRSVKLLCLLSAGAVALAFAGGCASEGDSSEVVADVKTGLTEQIAGARSAGAAANGELKTELEGSKRDLAAGIAGLKAEIAAAKVWARLLYVALAAGMLGTC